MGACTRMTVCPNRLLLHKHKPPVRFPVSLPVCHLSQRVKPGAAIPSQTLSRDTTKAFLPLAPREAAPRS